MKEDIRKANSYVLKAVFLNIIFAFILAFFEPNIGRMIIYTLTIIICVKMANKGHIEINFDKPNIKKLLLCMGITITAFPLASAFNILGATISGNTGSGIDSSTPVWLLIISVAIFPAVAEEIMYRGLIQGAYMKISGLYSILFSALAFALMHFSLSAMMYAFLYGCLFALVRIFTGNMIYSICMHLFFNLINIGSLYVNINTNGLRHISNVNATAYVMLAIVILSSVICGILIILLRRSSEVSLENKTCSAKDFISKENIIAYMICLVITICTL